jgi:large subunit ribosomal protein L4
LWRHGGTVHGPTPRSYEYALPKKMVLGALRSALSAKVAQQKLTIVDGWALESHKTKAFRQSLDKLDGAKRTILLVSNTADVNLERASRNLDGVTLVASTRLEPYDLLRHDRLMLSREAAVRLSRALSATKSEPDEIVQIEPAPAAKADPSEGTAAKAAPVKPKAQAAPKVAKKPAAAKAEKTASAGKKDKPKAKPKAKKE